MSLPKEPTKVLEEAALGPDKGDQAQGNRNEKDTEMPWRGPGAGALNVHD